MCGSEHATQLGSLGLTEWFRCRACGTDYTDMVPHPAQYGSATLAAIAASKAPQ